MSIDVKRQTAESEVTQHSVLFNSVTSERRSFEGCSMNASIRECEALGKGGMNVREDAAVLHLIVALTPMVRMLSPLPQVIPCERETRSERMER